jgi:hypothetical protein
MARRGGGRRGIDGSDLEPAGLEPADLETVDPAELRIERGREDRQDDRRRVAWIAFAAVVATAFTGVAVFGRVHHTRGASRPAPVPTTLAPAGQGADPVNRLVAHLGRYWPDGEAIVMYGRLYVSRAEDFRPKLVIPDLQAVIGDQSGSSLLISKFPEVLLSTEPLITSRVLSPHSVAIRATEPDEWWILEADGALRDTVTGSVVYPPKGLRVAAAVSHAFVALDVRRGQWVLWTGEPVTKPIVSSRAQLVAAQDSTVVFRSGCTINGCALEIFDLARHSAIDAYLPGVPEFAAFSPTGSRLALTTTLGDVFLVNPADGAVIARTRSRVLPTLSSPIGWSSDGQQLIVVQEDSVEVRDATDGSVTDVLTGTAGLEQLAGLP